MILEQLNDMFGIENEISAPILVSLIVFIIGLSFQLLFHLITSTIKKNKKRRTFKILINNSIIELRNRELNLKDFYRKLTVDYRGSNWSLGRTSISYSLAIEKMDYEKTFDAFDNRITLNKKLKEKAFHKIWSLIETVLFIEKSTEKSITTMIVSFNEHKHFYDDNLMQYNLVYDNLYKEFNGVKVQDKQIIEFFNGIFSIWNTWLNINESDRIAYNVSNTNLIEPTLALLKKHPSLARKFNLEIPVVNCATGYHQIESLLENYYDYFKNNTYMCRRARRILSKIEKII